MREALRLAALGRHRTRPNPMVGCVLAKDGRIVGTGYHRQAGGPHAEAFALQEAAEAARGATAYVTLEPCAHHGRTPPCAEALLRAGVNRVVAAMEDPDERVAGRGLQMLREEGVQTEVGLLAAEAEQLNRAWLHWKRSGRPLVTLKAAVTLDGKIACCTGDSRWVTGELARDHVHRSRERSDAILCGVGTVKADNPELTARPAGVSDPQDPLRVVVDSLARTPPTARLLHPEVMARGGKVLIACTKLAPPGRIQALREAGADVVEFEPASGLVPLPGLMAELGRRSVASLLVEGGGQIHWSFLQGRLAHRVMVYIAPKLIGGFQAPGWVGGPGLPKMADAWRLTGTEIIRIGEDLLLEGDLDVHGAG
jgi:diaminohydroxyphosphoribosylaminopyrimidine deaminase / 5-amino-6-(5-phosphoribosylamino)uracil reductase